MASSGAEKASSLVIDGKLLHNIQVFDHLNKQKHVSESEQSLAALVNARNLRKQ